LAALAEGEDDAPTKDLLQQPLSRVPAVRRRNVAAGNGKSIYIAERKMPKTIFSSDELPDHLDERARYKLWLDLFTDHLCTADISFFPDVPFYSRSEFMKFGDLAVTQLNGNIQSAVRTRRHVQNDTRGDYIIGTMLSNTRSLIKQDGREAVRSAGQTMLYTNAAPIDARHDAELSFRCVTVPQKLLAERVLHFEDLVITPLAPSPALRHLERYLAILVGSTLMRTRFWRIMSAHIFSI
jgi:hypothetical protein